MSDEPLPKSEIILYQTEDGRTRIQCRFENETVWLTQKLMAELFQKDVRTINEHIQNVFEEGELPPDSVIRKFRITAADGKTYETQHYSLEVVIAVGYRVKSARGTQFRIWATQRLKEYLVKGFTMDDERLKNPSGKGQKDYFDELLERIRDIRSSEKRSYQRTTRRRSAVLAHFAKESKSEKPRNIDQQLLSGNFSKDFSSPIVLLIRIGPWSSWKTKKTGLSPAKMATWKPLSHW
jgi:hypothetical protein